MCVLLQAYSNLLYESLLSGSTILALRVLNWCTHLACERGCETVSSLENTRNRPAIFKTHYKSDLMASCPGDLRSILETFRDFENTLQDNRTSTFFISEITMFTKI